MYIGQKKSHLSCFLVMPMMLTKAGEYAVRCMVFLAGKGELDVVPRREIAEAMDIPGPFLAKIAQDLSRAGLIQIVQGARGGHRLLKPASRITLLDVIEAVEGEIFLNECLCRPESCGRSGHCGVHNVWKEAREGLRRTLGGATLDQLHSPKDLAKQLCRVGDPSLENDFQPKEA